MISSLHVLSSIACAMSLTTAALAQPAMNYRSADATSGKVQRLGVYGNVQKDCTSGPLPAIRVLTPPKNGELSIRSGTLKAGRIARCPSLEAKAQGVFYRPNPKYTGPDEISYEVKSASGKVEAHTVRITVTAASATPDNKPAEEPDL